MSETEDKKYWIALEGEDAPPFKSRHRLKFAIALLSASCLALFCTNAIRAFGATSILGKSNDLAVFASLTDAKRNPATYLAAKSKATKGKGTTTKPPSPKGKGKGKGQIQEGKGTPPSKKRAAEESTSPGSAKKKKVDPVQEKISVICDALRSDEYEVDCSDMLLAAAPYALRDAKETRHKFYSNVVDMINDVFVAQEKRQKERLAEKQAFVDGADAQQRTLISEKENVEKKLEAEGPVLDGKKATQQTDQTFLKECESKAKEATKTATSVNATLKKVLGEKERYSEVEKTDLMALKDGTWKSPKEHKQHDAAVKKLLDDLSAPKGLVLALQAVFNQKPTARSSFDNITMTELDKIVATHHAKLDQQILDTRTELAEKEKQRSAAVAAAASAQEKYGSSTEAVTSEEAVREALQLELKEAQKAIKQHEAAVRKGGEDLNSEDSSLQALRNIMGQFTELRDRPEHPEPAAEAIEAAEEATEAAVNATELVHSPNAKSPSVSSPPGSQRQTRKTPAKGQSPMDSPASARKMSLRQSTSPQASKGGLSPKVPVLLALFPRR